MTNWNVSFSGSQDFVKTRLRILHLEDNPDDVELVRHSLEAGGFGCEIVCACGRKDFEAALAQGSFDLILSDYALPGFDGLRALGLARERQPDVPFILISGTIGEEQAVEAMKSEATDYVLKHRLTRLVPAVQRALQEAEERAKRRQAENAMHELSARLLRLQDEERRRIARELHDSVAQNLLGLGLSISSAQRLVPPNATKAHSLLADCAGLVDETTKSIRTLSYLLHPPVLDTLGLPGALRDYVDGFSRRSGIAVEFSVADDFGRLPSDLETALFRVVQESLTNVHRHSGSTRAKIVLRRTEHEVALEIQDFGNGISPTIARSPMPAAILGVGIAGMRERLRQLRGRLEIESGPGGTRVLAIVPLAVAP